MNPRFWNMLVNAAALTAIVVSGLSAQQNEELTVRHLRFRGNDHISDANLRVAIATSRADWTKRTPIISWLGVGRSPSFDELEFRRDVLRIEALYAARGFPDAAVDTVLERSGGQIDIDILIEEGEPIRVIDVTVQGVPSIVPESELATSARLTVGEPFDRIEYQTAMTSIGTLARDFGYPFASVTGRFTEDSVTKSARVTFDVETGPRATIGEIDIVGTQRIDERVILQHLTLRPGDVFSERAMYDSQLALFRTGLFTFVDVSLIDSTPAPPNDTLVTVNVRANIAEGSLRTARVGAGYGTLDCFRTRAGMELMNFAGDGRRLELTARLTQIGTGQPLGAGFQHSICPALADEDRDRLKLNYHVGATLREPLLFARHTSATIGAFAEQHTEIRAFLRRTVRGELSLTRDLARDVPITLTYALSRGITEANPVTFCVYLDICRVSDTRVFSEARRRSVLSLSFSRHTTNSLLSPTSGTALTSNVTWASKAIGSDTLIQFLRTEAELSAYHDLGNMAVLAWRFGAGVLFAPQRQLAGGLSRFVPPEERFYLGGPNSVRGFSQNELGPATRVLESITNEGNVTDSIIRTSATGADQFALANIELRFPLKGAMEGLSGALFVDAGMLTTRGNFTLSGVRVTPGMGVRLQTPIGPVGFDIAFNAYPAESGPLYRAEGSELVLAQQEYRPQRTALDRLRFHFAVGQAF